MTKEQLRIEYKKLLDLNTVEYSKEVIDRYLHFFFKVIYAQGDKPANSQRMADAKIIFQMFFSKLLSLQKALDGVSYQGKDGLYLNSIIDPTTFIPIARTIYESVCAFEIIYIIPDTEEKKDILYNIWSKAGLEYRQRFTQTITEPELLEKAAEEKQIIQDCKAFIEGTTTYKSLPEAEQGKIQTTMREKDYKIQISGSTVKKLSWQEISTLFGGSV